MPKNINDPIDQWFWNADGILNKYILTKDDVYTLVKLELNPPTLVTESLNTYRIDPIYMDAIRDASWEATEYGYLRGGIVPLGLRLPPKLDPEYVKKVREVKYFNLDEPADDKYKYTAHELQKKANFEEFVLNTANHDKRYSHKTDERMNWPGRARRHRRKSR